MTVAAVASRRNTNGLSAARGVWRIGSLCTMTRRSNGIESRSGMPA